MVPGSLFDSSLRVLPAVADEARWVADIGSPRGTLLTNLTDQFSEPGVIQLLLLHVHKHLQEAA